MTSSSRPAWPACSAGSTSSCRWFSTTAEQPAPRCRGFAALHRHLVLAATHPHVAPAKAGAHTPRPFPWALRGDGLRNNQGRWLWVLAFREDDEKVCSGYSASPTRRPCESRRPTRRPDGQISSSADCALSSPVFKKIPLPAHPKSNLHPLPSRPTEGRLAIVTDAGRDAMDAGGAEDESAGLADGEVVWS
jgi:hypothetical protein